jgi:Peptidase family M23
MRSIPGLSLAAPVAVLVATLVLHAPTLQSETTQESTPLLLTVHDAPVPFTGSDGRIHLVYELWMTNFTSGEAEISKVEVLADGAVLQTLDHAAISSRLQPAGQRESEGTIAKGAQSLLFLNVTLPPGAQIPTQLTHRVEAHYAAAPPGHNDYTGTGGATTVDSRPVAQIGPPLSGDNYISADSCCDATRHTRAALPVNGAVHVAQRYAVDWEQLDADNRIYKGPREKPESYTIFGKPVLAVADATVAVVVKGQPEQIPGKFPTDISLDQADGNAIILDLGQHRYALYAHMQPESIHLERGAKVKRGQIIGQVGNSGNSVAPHLHFQLMDSELSLGSNGLPYEIKSYQVTAETPGTKAFDEAEANGTPLAITRITPARAVKDALPLDQLILSFTPQ